MASPATSSTLGLPVDVAETDELLGRIAERLKAMGHPVRLKILHLLEGGERSVSQILAQVGGSQANISKQLNILRAVDLVGSRREGTSVFYSLRDAEILGVCHTVCDLLYRQAAAEVEKIDRARRSMRPALP